MSKLITAPSKFKAKRDDGTEELIENPWQGSVTLADPLTLPQVELIEEGLGVPPEITKGGTIFFTVLDKPQIPAIQACVEKWELSNFTADPFTMSPRRASHLLIEWLFGEIRKIYLGEQEIPNA